MPYRLLLPLSLGFGLVAATSQANGFLPYDDPAQVAAGEVLYMDYCAACHGAVLEGEPDWRGRDADGYLPAPPHSDEGHTWHHPDTQLFQITKYGIETLVGGGYKSRMTGFGDVMSDTEIAQTLAYIKSRWPARIIDIHNGINRQSE